jgi:hypothetical protein
MYRRNISTKLLFTSILFTTLFLLISAPTLPAKAQTAHSTSLKIKRETKKGARQAKKVKATYKDTHLNPDVHAFKKGQHGRRHFTPRDGYEFDESGYPVIENKPQRKGILRRN